jgi:tRNA/rRNA methyltransferase
MKQTRCGEIRAKVILSHPRNPDNIGAAARAMANFGVADLALVSPHLPSWRDGAASSVASDGVPARLLESTRAAVGAAGVLAAAKVHDSVPEAAADCDILLATSALQRRTPIRDVVRLSELHGFLAGRLPAGRPARVGLLFGSERSGLDNGELSCCHAILNIPTGDSQPSMNLGQAVALVCYELCGRSAGAAPRGARPAESPSLREVERVVEEIYGLLVEVRGPGRGARQHEAEVRRALLDARMTKGAMGILRILLRRAKSK